LHYGISIFPTAYSIRPGELAAAVEERGFESLWLPEHSHFPVSPMTPGHGQGGLPDMYYDLMDPFVSLGAAAQATRRIRLGTSICLVVQRDPIWLAKQVASLDVLSDGRFEFGVGGGWHPLEMGNHGTPFAERLEILRERLEAMKEIWTRDQAEYHGRKVDFGPIMAWPKPVQKPYPPIHVAANAPRGLGRVVRDGDGWMPLIAKGAEEATLDHIPTLRERLRAAGRDPESVAVSIYLCPQEEDVVRRCRDAGADRVIFLLDPEPRDAALAALDRLRVLAARIGG